MRGALLGSIFAVVAVTAAGAPAAVPGVPSMYVVYNVDCTFSMSVDPGTPLTATTAPGTILPPGTYDLLTTMGNPSSGYSPCSKPSFALTGPGVNVSILFPNQALNDERLITLQPSSTYVADDTNAPSATQTVFSTSATGSSTSLLPAPTTSTGKSSGTTQTDIVGSAIVPYRGKLAAAVSAAGKATLDLDGKGIGSLKAGRYEIAVDDLATDAGFFVQRAGKKALVVTTKLFVGKKTERVTLAAGTWTFFTKVGKPTRFTVTG